MSNTPPVGARVRTRVETKSSDLTVPAGVEGKVCKNDVPLLFNLVVEFDPPVKSAGEAIKFWYLLNEEVELVEEVQNG